MQKISASSVKKCIGNLAALNSVKLTHYEPVRRMYFSAPKHIDIMMIRIFVKAAGWIPTPIKIYENLQYFSISVSDG